MNLAENGQSITWENFIKHMQDSIIDSYKEDKAISDFKGDWKSDFKIVAKMLNMDVKSSKDNWSIVEGRIQA